MARFDIQGLLALVGALYFLAGAFLLGLFLMYAPWILTGDLWTQSREGLIAILSLPAFHLVNGIICWLIAYSLLAHTRWGRYLVIVYNSLWLGAFNLDSVTVLISGRPGDLFRGVPPTGIFVLFAIFTLLGGIIALCLRKDVKQLMVN
jgi:hypothetical protein